MPAQTKKTIAACFIVKNEEQFLEECLNSVKDFADEIIVVDTGSTDKTREIARTFTDKVFHFEWIDDFSAVRNFALDKAAADWVLFIDGDEIIAKKDHAIIRTLIEDEKYPLISMVQRNYTTNRNQPLFKSADSRYHEEAKGLPGYTPVEIIRIFKNHLGIKFQGVIHESVDQSMKDLNLKFLRTDIPIHHYQYLKPVTSHEEKLKKYIQLLEKNELQYPQNIKNLHDLAIVYLEQKKDLKKAFEYFKKIYDADHHLLEPYLGMGLIYARLKKWDKAATIFTKGLSNMTKKTIEESIHHEKIRQTILYNLAQCYTSSGEREKAKACFELLLKTNFAMKKKVKEKMEELG